MRFSAVLCDETSVESFSKFIGATSKLGRKRCCIRIQNDGLCFMSCEKLQDGGCWFCIFLPRTGQMFRQYDFSGFNDRVEEQNLIYLEANVDNFVKVLKGNLCYLKLKLTRTPAPDQDPIIRIEVRSVDSDIIRHEVPIKIIMSRHWSQYEKPSLGRRKMSIYLPPPKSLYKVLQTYKNLNATVIAFNASSGGDLRLEGTMDQGEIDVLFNDLSNDAAETDSQEDWARVKLMLKTVFPLFQSFFFCNSRVKLNIISNQMAEFSMRSDDHQLCFIVGNVTE
ncbi:unnamed protein product [Caenorhabditis auriculariae]|uniref:Checkpoint protein n=1 Tax=Caenorhabditis auriculariae TaxID=2777116 RepID=A0A8S1GSV0_9PELO|nr:unnamed protein product [Caenorhabditis auriculariae]